MEIVIRLTAEQYAKLSRPVAIPSDRQGGFQQLIVRLQKGIQYRQGSWELAMCRADAERVEKYATSYGKGTYQTQLQALLPQVEQAISQADAAQPDLFGEGENE